MATKHQLEVRQAIIRTRLLDAESILRETVEYVSAIRPFGKSDMELVDQIRAVQIKVKQLAYGFVNDDEPNHAPSGTTRITRGAHE